MHTFDTRSLAATQLRLTRARLRAALDASTTIDDLESGQQHAWLETCTENERAFAHIEPENDGLPITWLRGRLGLTPTEERVLWVLIAHELCPHARQLVRDLNSETTPDPTLDAVRRAVYGVEPELQAWHELAPDGVLRTLCLVEEIGTEGPIPDHRMTFRVARRVLALVHGAVGLDRELAGIATLEPTPIATHLEVVALTHARIRAALASANGLTLLYGRPGSGRRSLLTAQAEAAGCPVLTVDARRLARDAVGLCRQLRLIRRECRLLRRVPLFLHLDALADTADGLDRLEVFEREVIVFVLATADKLLARRWNRPPTMIELPVLNGAQRASLWRRALPAASDGDADLLSTMYPLAPALIQAVGTAAIHEAKGSEMQPCHVEAGIRLVLDDRLAGLANRVNISQSWEDLVLPEDQTTAIVELLARVRERRRVYEDWGFANKVGRGLGVVALFSGPPGTGKTMCAGLIARDLRTELYQVDVSKMVSKWVGETQKNLASLFDAAEAGQAVLLFDEADALFGKRTDVRSSNDRSANQEVNYLLQRVESFGGICILTTNHENAIDEAFRRRLSAHVRFPMPDGDERARLWRAMLPAQAPTEVNLPFEELARKYLMTGGHIRNAVLRATFLAADEERPISAEHLQHAARLEYEAMGKLVAASA